MKFRGVETKENKNRLGKKTIYPGQSNLARKERSKRY